MLGTFFKIMLLSKLSNYQKQIDEINSILSKLQCILNANLGSDIVQTETDAGHVCYYSKNIISLNFYQKIGMIEWRRVVELSYSSINIYLSGVKLLAENYKGENFVDYIDKINCA